MLNHSRSIEVKLSFVAGIFFGVLILGFSIFRGDVILVDPFHYGEFFAATVALFGDVYSPFHPLTIHGALNFIPGLFAEYIWGGENYFLPTYAIYKILNFVAAIFLILIAYELMRYKNHQWLILLAVTVVSHLFVGYRDLILLLSIYLFLKINDRDIGCNSSVFLQILFGIVVAFGLFWSYDRGIAGALSLGAAVLVLLFRNRWYAISLITFVVTVIGIGLFFKILSIENYISSIYILMQTSGQWSYGWKIRPVLLSVFAVIFNVTVLAFFINECLKSKSFIQRLPIIVCFVFLSLFMLKRGINRADLFHIYSSCWIPMLILLFLYEKTAIIKNYIGLVVAAIFMAPISLSMFFGGYGLAMVAGILLFIVLKFKNEFLNKLKLVLFSFLIAICVGLIARSGVKAVEGGEYSWINSLSSPASNRLSATDGVVWVSDRLQERSVECVFDLSNNGVINGLVRRPSCSRFTYPVYAGSKHETILISDLKKASPQAVVYSSAYWSYSIDGKNMRSRFPELDTFILKSYPREECKYGYCVRYQED